jgi:uncharacterized protein
MKHPQQLNFELTNEKELLQAKLEAVTLRNELKNAEYTNSLTSLTAGLISGGQQQSNLVSFNPTIENNLYAPLTINWIMLTYMYKTHGIIQTMIDEPVLDAFRGGIDIVSGELDTDDIHELQDWEDEIGAIKALRQAEIWARLYGGAVVIINTDQDPEKPFKVDQLREGSKIEFYPANRWELTTSTGWNPSMNGMDILPWKTVAHPADDYFYFYSKRIHRSRMIILTGKEAPYLIKWQLAGWGMSEIEKILPDWNRYIRTAELVLELMREAKVDVYSFKGLKESVTSAPGEAKMMQRVSLANQQKAYNSAVLLDMEDKFEQKQLSFSGLAEMMKENRMNISSATRIPQNKLFGMGATGFNSGEDDIENYNAMIESEVREKLKPSIRMLYKMLCQAKFGFEPDIHCEWKPLRVMSSEQEEIVKTSKHNRYLSLYNAGLLNSKEMGDLNEKEKLIPIETDMAKGILDEHPQPAMMQGEEGGEQEKKPNESKRGKPK